MKEGGERIKGEMKRKKKVRGMRGGGERMKRGKGRRERRLTKDDVS